MHTDTPDLFELSMSDDARPLMDAVLDHIDKHVVPITEEFFALNKEKEDRWSWHPRQLELLDGAKQKAKGDHQGQGHSHRQPSDLTWGSGCPSVPLRSSLTW